MNEPPLAASSVHQRALMWTIDFCRTLREHDFFLVRSRHIPRTQHKLPSRRHAACGREDVIPTVALQKLRPLNRRMLFRFMENNLSVAQQTRAIRSHRADSQAMLHTRARTSIGMSEICFPIVIPERAGVDQSLAG